VANFSDFIKPYLADMAQTTTREGIANFQQFQFKARPDYMLPSDNMPNVHLGDVASNFGTFCSDKDAKSLDVFSPINPAALFRASSTFPKLGQGVFTNVDLPARTRLPLFVWGAIIPVKKLLHEDVGRMANQGAFQLGAPYEFLAILADPRCPACKLNDPHETNLVANARFVQHDATKLLTGNRRANLLVQLETTAPVARGQELMIEYGPEWWDKTKATGPRTAAVSVFEVPGPDNDDYEEKEVPLIPVPVVVGRKRSHQKKYHPNPGSNRSDTSLVKLRARWTTPKKNWTGKRLWHVE